ncbi:hypothetical protein KHQ82_01220 [Mycoplasmatota bacterium]|nr:hypothetical protein KHQ82_01220 [Mycoplasmatota bacterium]
MSFIKVFLQKSGVMFLTKFVDDTNEFIFEYVGVKELNTYDKPNTRYTPQAFV